MQCVYRHTGPLELPGQFVGEKQVAQLGTGVGLPAEIRVRALEAAHLYSSAFVSTR